MNTNKNILKILFFPLLILYYETILRIFLFDAVFNMGYIYMCLFSFPLGLLFYLLSKAFNEKTNKILFYVIVIFLTLYYCVQILSRSTEIIISLNHNTLPVPAKIEYHEVKVLNIL